MKTSLFYFIFGGLVVTVVLQAILFASTGLQSSRLEKQIIEVNQKFDRLEYSLEATKKIITKINSFIDEPLPSDPQTSVPTDPNDPLSPENLSKILKDETL